MILKRIDLICYADKKGEWNKGLSLWTQMQEDNIQPSNEFLIRLEHILVQNNEPVPFNLSSNTEPYSAIHKEFQNLLNDSFYDKAKELLKK